MSHTLNGKSDNQCPAPQPIVRLTPLDILSHQHVVQRPSQDLNPRPIPPHQKAIHPTSQPCYPPFPPTPTPLPQTPSPPPPQHPPRIRRPMKRIPHAADPLVQTAHHAPALDPDILLAVGIAQHLRFLPHLLGRQVPHADRFRPPVDVVRADHGVRVWAGRDVHARAGGGGSEGGEV